MKLNLIIKINMHHLAKKRVKLCRRFLTENVLMLRCQPSLSGAWGALRL